MARKSKAEKALDAAYDAAFRKHADRVQFNIFDLSKVRAEALEAVGQVPDAKSDAAPSLAATFGPNWQADYIAAKLDLAMPAIVAKYRQN